MTDKQILINIKIVDFHSLDEKYRDLIDKAKLQTNTSYAPYSQFSVGAAVLLENGQVVCGNNQENAASPSGLCAERVAMFYANSHYPDVKPIAIAIAAKNKDGFLPNPISPCGGCRQSLLETENRYKSPIMTLLYGTNEIFVIDKISHLLPLAFSQEYL
jgi:cytidine deaminase